MQQQSSSVLASHAPTTPAQGAGRGSGGQSGQPEGKAAAPKARRSCCGCLFSAGLGLVALFFGSWLAFTVVGLGMLGPYVRGVLAAGISEKIAGEVEIAEALLEFEGEQQLLGVRILDPQGMQVLLCDIAVPSIEALLDSGPLPGTWKIRVREADIVVDPQGISNLERALAPIQKGSANRSELRINWWGEKTLSDLLWDQTFHLLIESKGQGKGTGIRWRDERPGGKSGRVTELFFTLDHHKLVGPGRLDGAGRVALEVLVAGKQQAGDLDWDFSVSHPRVTPWDDVTVRVAAHSFPSAALTAIGAIDTRLTDLLGERFDLDLQIAGNPRKGAPASLSINGPSVKLDAYATLQNDLFISAQENCLVAHFPGAAARLAPSIDDWLAGISGLQQQRIRAASPDGELVVIADSFRIPLGLNAVEVGGSSRSWMQAEFEGLAKLDGQMRLQSVAEGANDLGLRLSDLQFDFILRPLLPGVVGISGRLIDAADNQVGLLDGECTTEVTLAQWLAGGSRPLRVDLSASGTPTALLDAASCQSPLLVELLGPRHQLELVAQWNERERRDDDHPARLVVRASSARGWINFNGLHTGTTLSSGDAGSITASLPLGASFKKRCIRPLVPWLEELDKPADVDPVQLEATDFSFDLTGKRAQAQVKLSLDLGIMEYRYHPGVKQLIGRKPSDIPFIGRIEPIQLEVDGSLITYSILPLSVDGVEFSLHGTLNQEDGSIDFKGDVPVSLMGSQGDFDQKTLGMLIPPEVTTLVHLTGTWDEPVKFLAPKMIENSLLEYLGEDYRAKVGEIVERLFGFDETGAGDGQ